jgi:RNA polymerase sigma factor (sigma-70 family)
LAGEESLNATDALLLRIFRKKARAFGKDSATQDDPENHAAEVILMLINAMKRDPPPPWLEGPRPRINAAANTIAKRYLAALLEKKMRNVEMLSLDMDEKLALTEMIDDDGEDAMGLDEAMEQLEPHHRQALQLRAVEGYSFAKVAESMGKSVEAVKAYVRLARQQLRDAMGRKRPEK